MTTSREPVEALAEEEEEEEDEAVEEGREEEGESWTRAMGMSGVTCSSATRAGS